MAIGYSEEFGEWVVSVLKAHGITSSRQAEPRTGLSHTTINNMKFGRLPDEATVIHFAAGFGQDIPKALKLAGYVKMALLWETGAAPIPEREQEFERLDEHEEQLVSYYRRASEYIKPHILEVTHTLSELPYDDGTPPIGGRKGRARYEMAPARKTDDPTEA